MNEVNWRGSGGGHVGIPSGNRLGHSKMTGSAGQRWTLCNFAGGVNEVNKRGYLHSFLDFFGVSWGFEGGP